MISVFQRDETVPIWVYVEDWDGNAFSPDQGVKITITDPKGTVKVTAQAMTETETGVFLYEYVSQLADEIDWWKYFARGQDGTGAGAKIIIVLGGFHLQ